MLQALGFLRLSLLGFALLNTLPALLVQVGVITTSASDGTLGALIVHMVAPVMAPLFLVVILFDYVMSRIQAADAEGEAAVRYATIARIELTVMLFTLLAWIPFFISLVR